MQNRRIVSVTAGFWCLISAMLLILPLQWVTAIFVSSAVHELCHYWAAKLNGLNVRSIQLSATGVYMHMDAMLPRQEIICALSGPLGGLALLLLGKHCPRTAFCAIVQSCYHLLPILPLDGGRIFRGLYAYLGIPGARTVRPILETSVLVLLFILTCYLSFICNWGSLPVIFSIVLFLRIFREKYLANSL